MAQTQAVIATLKQALRASGRTYADVARALAMSEANVKRMFATERMSLDRIEAICQLMAMDLSDLFALYDQSRKRIRQLSVDQEQELVADSKLLLVAVCVRNDLNFREILDHHRISEHELIRCLAKLDRLKVIDLLPNNKIKLRIDENFRWIPRGPIERFYESVIQQEFMAGDFAENGRVFIFGLLSDTSRAILENKLKLLADDFIQLHRHDRQLPFAQRHSVAMLLAVRGWALSTLSPYIKTAPPVAEDAAPLNATARQAGQ